MNEFKIGDIVVAKKNSNYSITTDGWKGKVIDVRDDNEYRVGETIRVVNLDGYTRCEDWVNPKYFYKENTNTEKETTKMAKFNEFKVGDLVRANANANGYGITTEGWIGVVIDRQTVTKEIKVAGSNLTGSGSWVNPCAFDVLNPETLKITEQGVPEIKDVIFNEPATIIFWNDDTKTVVKCGEGEKYDPEKGLALCIAKKTLGNKYEYYEPFKKWVGKYNKQKEKKASASKVEKKPVAKKATPKSTAKKATGRKTKK